MPPNAFVRKIGEGDLIDAFSKVVADLKVFALPALRAVAREEKLTQQWKAGTGWTVSRNAGNRALEGGNVDTEVAGELN